MSTNRALLLAVLLLALFASTWSATSCESSPGTRTETPTAIASTTLSTAPLVTGDRAELLAEIERIRAGLEDGTLVVSWPERSDLPSDFQGFLDGLEQSVYEPNLIVYLEELA
jgi:hypothetical protein